MKEKTSDIDILEEGIKKMIQDERIHDDYRDMITAISNLILDNYILKSKVEELLKEKIEWCIKASNSGLNAIQYACSKEDEIERIERHTRIIR